MPSWQPILPQRKRSDFRTGLQRPPVDFSLEGYGWTDFSHAIALTPVLPPLGTQDFAVQGYDSSHALAVGSGVHVVGDPGAEIFFGAAACSISAAR